MTCSSIETAIMTDMLISITYVRVETAIVIVRCGMV